MPVPRVPDDRISSTKQLVDHAINLTDEEVAKAGRIVGELQLKYGRKANTSTNLEALRDEALTRLAEVGILATFDPTPCFYGEAPVIEFIGSIDGHAPFDHEKKRHEVIESKKRNEDYRGQKEPYNKRKKLE